MRVPSKRQRFVWSGVGALVVLGSLAAACSGDKASPVSTTSSAERPSDTIIFGTSTTAAATTTTEPATTTTVPTVLPTDTLFDPGSALIKPEGVSIVRDLVASFNGVAPRSIELVGHTDHREDDETNLELSVQRANAVRDALIAAGIDPTVITATGVGERDAHQPPASEDEMRADRRVDITVTF